MKKQSRTTIATLSLLIFSLLILNASLFASEESLTITTYYPSPYGSYRELRSQRMAIGDDYIQGSAYCWEGSCTNTISADADLVVQGNVGIGTTGPAAKLSIMGGTGPALEIIRGADITNSIIPTIRLQHDRRRTYEQGVYYDGTFRIKDIDSGNYAMTIDSNQNVGIGTTGPQAKLHLWGNNPQLWIQQNPNIGGNSLLRITAAGPAGNWGGISLLDSAYIYSDDRAGGLINFGPNSIFENTTMAVNTTNGFVGIGTTTPTGRLTVRGGGTDANGFLKLENTAGYSSSIYLMANNELRFNLNDGSSVGWLNNIGWGFASDRAFKKDIVEMSKYGLATVMLMHPREYKIKSDNSPHIGFIAQEMQALIPEVVSGEEGQLGISYGTLTAVLAKAIQEQQRQIEELKSEINKLKAK